MRLKTFSAASLAEAMEMVRLEMGAEAIIVLTQDNAKAKPGAMAVVTAAIEDSARDLPDFPAEVPRYAAKESEQVIRQALQSHGTPSSLAKRLAEIGGALDEASPAMALAGALQRQFAFAPLIGAASEGPGNRRIMLIGPPGSGKTIATAKLATQAAMDKDIIGIVTTDARRAGGIEQLAAFARILDLPMAVAEDAEELAKLLKRMGKRASVLIDTPGTNPYDDGEMAHLKSLVDAANMETVLVMAAGGDADESADIAARFAAIGAKRLLVTRLDVSRRLGSILAAADAGGLILSEISMSPNVAEGIDPIRPKTLARTIMPYCDARTTHEVRNDSADMPPTPAMTEAAS